MVQEGTAPTTTGLNEEKGDTKMFNRKEIMTKAWETYRKYDITFGEALHRAWNAAKAAPINKWIIADAKAMNGIDEEVDTYAGWKRRGYLVRHGEKNLFQTVLAYATKGDGKNYKASFFGRSQVEFMLG